MQSCNTADDNLIAGDPQRRYPQKGLITTPGLRNAYQTQSSKSGNGREVARARSLNRRLLGCKVNNEHVLQRKIGYPVTSLN